EERVILIVEVGITSFDNIRVVDLLANHCASINGYKTRIIPYVMTWKGITTTFNKKYRSELNISKVLKMTLESLSIEACIGEQITEEQQVVTEKELEEQTVYRKKYVTKCSAFDKDVSAINKVKVYTCRFNLQNDACSSLTCVGTRIIKYVGLLR
ncbi:hypothetical protein NAPIS_ORF00316, partial [Vairimorpha apis BRL 01]